MMGTANVSGNEPKVHFCLQCEGHNVGLNLHGWTFSPVSSELLNLLQLNLLAKVAVQNMFLVNRMKKN